MRNAPSPASRPPRCRFGRARLLPGALCMGALLLVGVPVPPAGADEAGEGAARYRDCTELASRNPPAGFEAANAWRSEGGGAPAIHCAALALSALGENEGAAELLEGLAGGGLAEGDPPQAARLLVQAGRAWLAANRLDRAESAQGRAISLVPAGAEPWVDRAITRAAAGRFAEARTDLDRALEIDPEHAEARVLRASALRRLGDPREALADLERVLAADGPVPADALIERGRVLAELGDTAGARADLLAVLRALPEESPSVAAARAELEALDLQSD